VFFPSFPINIFAYEIAIFITIAVLLIYRTELVVKVMVMVMVMEVDFTTTYAITTDVVSSTLCFSIFSFMCMFCRSLSFCTFSVGRCVVCSSSIYRF
jgi:hypothetical protein